VRQIIKASKSITFVDYMNTIFLNKRSLPDQLYYKDVTPGTNCCKSL